MSTARWCVAGQRYSLAAAIGTTLTAIMLGGCRHQTTTAAYQPPPPTATTPAVETETKIHTTAPASAPVPAPSIPMDIDDELAAASPGFFDDITGTPVASETGIASWYGPYRNRRTADGSAYDGLGMTAAHKTFPLGTTVRVTNTATGLQILVRITDRGPFAPGRVIDLSINAAKAIGLYRMGIGKVQLEAFAHPSADPNGKWCVQTGPFKAEEDALDLKAALIERYSGSKVAEFAGATGYWVRIDSARRTRADADEIMNWIGQPDPQALPYVVRID